jgi:hypothetical protein
MAAGTDSSFTFLVKVEQGAITVQENPDSNPESAENLSFLVTPGDTISALTLDLKNKDASGNAESVIDSLSISVRNKLGESLSPSSSSISQIVVISDNGSVVDTLGVTGRSGFGGSIIPLAFAENPLIVRGDSTKTIRIIVEMDSVAHDDAEDFRVSIDSLSHVRAYDLSDVKKQQLQIHNPDENVRNAEKLAIASKMIILTAADFTKSFFNYPNPFGRADDPDTKFVYFLQDPSDVQIRIYTLTGDLVKTWDYTQAEHPDETSAGLHDGQIIWDGRNGMEEMVLNGVYLAYIITDFGQSMTKIAVVK